MATLSIRERIEARALEVAAAMTGVGTAYRADYRRLVSDFGHLDVLVQMGDDQVEDLDFGVTEKTATLDVIVVIAPAESDATPVAKLINQWLERIEASFVPESAFTADEVQLVVDHWPIASHTFQPSDRQGMAEAGMSFNVVYRHDRGDPTTFGAAIAPVEDE